MDGLRLHSKDLGGNKCENYQLTNLQVFQIMVFSAQIAHLSLEIIRYNLLASIKRTLDYETIGTLFNDVYEGVHKQTVIDKIWEIILELVAVVAEKMDIDDEIIMEQILEKSERLEAFRQLAETAKSA